MPAAAKYKLYELLFSEFWFVLLLLTLT
jgi:hypothetical protein